MSYSRHAMKDEDMSMNHDVNYRVHMHVRRMLGEQKKGGRARRRANKELEAMEEENGRVNGGVTSKVRGDHQT